MNEIFFKTVESFGVSRSSLLPLNSKSPKSINYSDLQNLNSIDISPCAVFSDQGNTTIYFVDATSVTDPKKAAINIHQLRNILSCRGEQAVLAVIEPGQLYLYSINIDGNSDSGQLFSESSQKVLLELIEGTLPESLSNYLYGTGDKRFLYNLLLDLLKDVGTSLNETLQLAGKHETITSLIGRALFTRFLIDRKVLTVQTAPSLFQNTPLESCFSSPESCLVINQWLDSTFNGDLLPLNTNDYKQWFLSFEETIFKKLTSILNPSDKNGQMFLPSFVDFSHVPVGLLSEVYESFLHENLDKNVRQRAKDYSVHYTPYHIANYMFEETLASVETSEPHLAKILDPSCGAGVFLITAFRRLIRAHWEATGEKPDTFKIRNILYNQIMGFDINREALNLSALGLYLSAIELDDEPLPTSKLKFHHNLIGKILIHSVTKNESEGNTIILGSLGQSIGNKYNSTFDIVIGNPPWTSLKDSCREELTKVIRSVAKRRSPLLKEIAKHHINPDQVPDLPFVWKSMEWAKPHANIALVLHARFLFKTSPVGVKSRNDLLKALNVTGIMNASALRQTKAWEGHGAQFCVCFAKNELPELDSFFYFISPYYSKHFNQIRKTIKIDYSNAEPIQPSTVIGNPSLLKTLYKGTALDAQVIKQIHNTKNTIPLKSFWDNCLGKNKSGQGYKVATKTKNTSELLQLNPLNLTKHDDADYIIDTSKLKPFDIPYLEAPRKNSIYIPPLVLINKAIGANPKTASCRISLDSRPIAYNESFYGYSTSTYKNPKLLAKYLFALFNSKLFLHYCLMTSSEYGIEREAIQKQEVDAFPFVNPDALSTQQEKQISSAFQLFQDTKDLSILDKLICEIYNLSTYDLQTIYDTLDTELPIASSKNNAIRPVTTSEIRLFCETLNHSLSHYTRIENIFPLSTNINAWNFICIKRKSIKKETAAPNELPLRLMEKLANATSTSKVIIEIKGCIYIGLLNQYRFWTISRSRLLAIEIENNSLISKGNPHD